MYRLVDEQICKKKPRKPGSCNQLRVRKTKEFNDIKLEEYDKQFDQKDNGKIEDDQKIKKVNKIKALARQPCTGLINMHENSKAPMFRRGTAVFSVTRSHVYCQNLHLTMNTDIVYYCMFV